MKWVAVILALALGAVAQIPLPPMTLPPPAVRTFTATSYVGTNESAPSDAVTTTNPLPLTIAFDAPPMPVEGFRLYMTNQIHRVRVFDLGTNTSFTVALTSTPAPPFNLVLAVAPAVLTVSNHLDAQRFYRAVVQTSSNLTDWNTFAGLQITLTTTNQ